MKILSINDFRVNATITGVYDGKHRSGTVVQVLDNRVRVDVGGGQFRMFSVDKLGVASIIYTVDKPSYQMEVRTFYNERGTETITLHKDKF